jgi:hypothetical protein
MRRFGQQLPLSACEEILANEKRGVLALLGDESYPYALPLNYVFDNDALYFHSAVEGHKIDAIASHDKASFCVYRQGEREEGDWWYHVYSVIAFGRIRLVEDEGEKLDALRLLGKKYFPPAVDIEADIARNRTRVAVLKLEIEHMSGKHVREN